MKALIVEDEPMALRNLKRILEENFPDIEVTGSTSSVHDTVEWLSQNICEIIFMDVELQDGTCFDIFRKTDVRAKVVMTTAYDSYALKAFEVNSIDYILKPVELPALQRAVDRCRQAAGNTDVTRLLAALSQGTMPAKQYKERFLVRLNDRIVPVDVSAAACFYSENKATYLMVKEGKRYVLNPSLDEVEAELDPGRFFRISRSCIIAKECVQSVVKLSGGRLKVMCSPGAPADAEVSRARVDDFLAWLEK